MDDAARPPKARRVWLGLASVVALVAAYTLLSNAYQRPQILPPTQRLVDAFVQLVGAGTPLAASTHVHTGDHIGGLVEQRVTLQGSLLISTYRVLIGVAVGGSLGILAGLLMGWSRAVDEYAHPIYILFRSVPPLALITYVMLWFGHGTAHVLLPIIYAVFTAVVIPTYHGVRDVADIYVKAARALGARGRLLLSRVVLPAASPFVLAGLRYGLIIAWMTTVGVEMLMADEGIGYLLIGGGMWSSRLEVAGDPAVIVVGIVALALVGYAMDLGVRVAGDRLTAWVKR
jgi:NitT/TauT family transport system permease protein